ncbi:MAG: acetate/propionate family kinase [Deltaproteobacteria bacterium]
MKILVLNSGSSSIKFQLVETDVDMIASNTDRCLAKGTVERIGTDEASLRLEAGGKPFKPQIGELLDHRSALMEMLTALKESGVIADITQVQAVGHRVVHGGEQFSHSVIIDEEVAQAIQQCSELAPLHNPHNLRGYYVARKVMPQVPQVAVFDTAFHQSLPPRAYLYGIPYTYYRRYKIRRYGFHGTSHRYVAFRYRQLVGKGREDINLITCHLGNGCSMTAIEKGKSVDTTMGFTPLEGLVMGTRSGDLDPAVVLYLMSKDELTLHDVTTLLNKFSGLYGLSGESNDMRELLAASAKGDEQAKVAIEVFAYRIRRYIGAYTAAMGHVDALIFTGGIGENAPAVRELACERLAEMGFQVDPVRNQSMVGKEGEISTESSRARVMVIPTNEELLIARDTFRCVRGIEHPH